MRLRKENIGRNVYVMLGTLLALYVYLTHQTGTYGSTMRNMRSMLSPISGPYNGTYSRAPRTLYLSHIHCLPAPPDTDESSWLPSQFGRYNGETLLHSGEKLRLEKNPNEVHARDQLPGEEAEVPCSKS